MDVDKLVKGNNLLNEISKLEVEIKKIEVFKDNVSDSVISVKSPATSMSLTDEEALKFISLVENRLNKEIRILEREFKKL